MKVVVYETDYSSLFSIICSLVTMSGYSHAAIINRGVVYDTTFLRGCLNIADKAKDSRKVVVIDVGGDCNQWIEDNLFTPYDTIGLLLWPFGIDIKKKMYCFEVVDKSLKSIVINPSLGKRKSGGKIIDALLNTGHKAELMTGKQFNELYKSN